MSLLGGVKSFLVEKFWLPIINESVFYNPFNTAVYSTLFALAAAYIGYPTLKKLDVDLNRKFFTGMAPFVFLGGAMRSLKDIDALDTILLETPLIYFLMFGLIVSTIIASKKLQDRTGRSYHHYMLGTGSILLLATLPFYSINNVQGLMMVLGVTAVWIALFYSTLKIVQPELLRPSFYLPVGAHYMDAAVTSVALLFPGTAEKHVLARYFIELLGPFGMFLMKTLIIVPAVYYIMKEVEGGERNYYLFLIALLGFAIATRNLLSFVTLT